MGKGTIVSNAKIHCRLQKHFSCHAHIRKVSLRAIINVSHLIGDVLVKIWVKRAKSRVSKNKFKEERHNAYTSWCEKENKRLSEVPQDKESKIRSFMLNKPSTLAERRKSEQIYFRQNKHDNNKDYGAVLAKKEHNEMFRRATLDYIKKSGGKPEWTNILYLDSVTCQTTLHMAGIKVRMHSPNPNPDITQELELRNVHAPCESFWTYTYGSNKMFGAIWYDGTRTVRKILPDLFGAACVTAPNGHLFVTIALRLTNHKSPFKRIVKRLKPSTGAYNEYVLPFILEMFRSVHPDFHLDSRCIYTSGTNTKMLFVHFRRISY